MKKIILLVILLFSFNVKVNAITYEFDGDKNQYFNYESQLDESYYSSLAGLTGDSFRSELNDIITENFKWYTYASKNRYEILPKADAVHGKPGMVYCIYTGKIFRGDGHGTSGKDIWNTEHVWAKSHGFPSDKMLPYSDYHHLRVSEGYTNTLRNNRFIGSVDGYEYEEDEYGNRYTGREHSIWEPRDSVKGDVARMLLYMDVRYDGELETEIDLVLLDDYEFPDEIGAPHMGHLSTLLQWHNDDPVDDRERYRNDVIYSYQKNRNPFIDRPEYVNTIWGYGVDKELEQVENFNMFIDDITDITIDSLHDIGIGFALYNRLSDYQKEFAVSYVKLEEYYEIYQDLTNYSNKELDILLEFYNDYLFLDDILNGNYYELGGSL